jgi:anti-anti-sigma factor
MSYCGPHGGCPSFRRSGGARPERPSDRGADDIEVAALRTVICDLINSGRMHVIMNLSGLTHVDARGLGEIAQAAETVQTAGGRLMLMAASPRIATMLAVSRLDTRFEWCDTDPDFAD